MQDEHKSPDDDIDDDDESLDADPDDTVVLSEDDFTDSDDDLSAEVNIEELVARVESEQKCDVARQKEIRRRLEEVAESKSFEDTYAIDFDSK